MSGSWDAMLAHEAEHDAVIESVPGIAPSVPASLHVASSQAGLASFRRCQVTPDAESSNGSGVA